MSDTGKCAGCGDPATHGVTDINAPGGVWLQCDYCRGFAQQSALAQQSQGQALAYQGSQLQQAMLQNQLGQQDHLAQQRMLAGAMTNAEQYAEIAMLRARVAELEARPALTGAEADEIQRIIAENERLETRYKDLRNEGQQRITAMQDALGTLRSEHTELLADYARLRRELGRKR